MVSPKEETEAFSFRDQEFKIVGMISHLGSNGVADGIALSHLLNQEEKMHTGLHSVMAALLKEISTKGKYCRCLEFACHHRR